MQQHHGDSGDCEFVNLQELEGLACARLPKMVFDYYAGGAGSEASLQYNASAFGHYKLLPRMLVDVSTVDMSCELFGAQLAHTTDECLQLHLTPCAQLQVACTARTL